MKYVCPVQLKGKFVIVTSPLEAEDSAPVANFFGADTSIKQPQVQHFCIPCPGSVTHTCSR